jgi:predicted CXXCH cytochrome family protein
MRKLGLFIIAIAVLALIPAVSSAGSIVSTAHDLSGAGYGTDQICVFCHTPHNAKTPQLAPLWNHVSTTATYTLYSSPSLNAAPGQPANNSKACLSCHDGTVAVDAYGTRTTGTTITGTALLGTTLSDDHPISFTYDAALATADGGLVTPAGPGSVVAGIPLYTSTLQCASCHDVHDNDDAPFLRNTNAASALCLKCHIK